MTDDRSRHPYVTKRSKTVMEGWPEHQRGFLPFSSLHVLTAMPCMAPFELDGRLIMCQRFRSYHLIPCVAGSDRVKFIYSVSG